LRAARLREQVERIGLAKDQLGDARTEPGGGLHRDRAAERVPDDPDVVRIRRHCGLDEMCLVVQRLRSFVRPGGRLAVAEQIDRADAEPVLQVIHQAAPLPRARNAGVHEHDDRTGSASLQVIDLHGGDFLGVTRLRPGRLQTWPREFALSAW